MGVAHDLHLDQQALSHAGSSTVHTCEFNKRDERPKMHGWITFASIPSAGLSIARTGLFYLTSSIDPKVLASWMRKCS
jgi:hypothetical protein